MRIYLDPGSDKIKDYMVQINKAYSFPRGGIKLSDSSVPPRNSSVTAFLPSISIISLNQHSGGQAVPVVSVGDYVKEGMLIGRSSGYLSCNVHASVPGKVIKIVKWTDSFGQRQEGIVIHMEGSFEKLGRRNEIHSWESMNPYDIQRCISEHGVVEMEGSGRPVADIISTFRDHVEQTSIVVRCVFDDPWLAADYVLTRERLNDIIEGAAIAAKSCNASRIIYAVSYKEKELGILLKNAGFRWGLPVSLVYFGSRYPQRNKRELELTLRNYEKKEGTKVASLFILGPATLAAICDAVKFRKPVLERYVAIGGTAVNNPKIMKLRIGTRIGDIFDECGGFKGKIGKIASGSPFLGRPVLDLDEPLVKMNFALFANLSSKLSVSSISAKRKNVQRNCISCGSCRSVCPVGLDPEEIYKSIFVDEITGSFRTKRAVDCHGCGCCELVCPSSLPLSTEIISKVTGGIYE